MNNANTILSIYKNTFSDVGQKFLDSLMQQITIETKVSSTILLQLLSAEEYKELSTIYQFHILHSSSNTSSPSNTMDEDELKDQFLLVRSSYSIHTEIESIKKNTIIPLSCLNSQNSLYIKALFNDSKLFSKYQEQNEEDIYPPFKQFISSRLECVNKQKNDFIRGIICIFDNHPIEECRYKLITEVLDTVHDRCINELNQLQKQEQLVSARDLALLDAENKLKFLADMSHEIRTPMNAVIALTDLLLQERSTLNMEQIEHLEVIQTSGSHLLTIINDILDISKLNHDPKFKLESRRFSLRKCLKDTLNMARHQASMSQQNKVVYVLECPQDKDDNVPLPQLISQLENNGILLRPLSHKQGKTVLPVIWKIDHDVPDYLLGDTMRLTQIMLNLCSNAVKFTKQGGIHIHIKRSTPTPIRTPIHNEKRMTFKERYDAKIETMWNRALQEKRERSNNPLSPTSSSNNSSAASGLVTEDFNDDYFTEKAILEISVTDTGIGIPADRLPKLFKSFSQIDISTARRYGGTGLGLAISSTLVNRMGGCVWVESEEGVGSRFALTLPMPVAPRDRNYSSDSTPLGFVGSPSSPSSTVSDASSTHNESPHYTFTTPVVTPNNPSYFPLTAPPLNQQTRPLLPRTTHQLPTNEPELTPMAEDTTILTSPATPTPPQQKSSGINIGSSSSNTRRSYNDLLSPAPRNTRVAITKYHKKPPTKEENLAKLHPLRILLAEDNILNQKIAISILKRLGYVDVAIANNGKEVLQLMKTSDFDVIFMDLYMPEMDGLEVTREIIKERNKPETPSILLNTMDVYIIALTASASREDRQICIDAGMNDFISKPFTMTEMKSALKTCANKRKKRRKLTEDTNDPMLGIEK